MAKPTMDKDEATVVNGPAVQGPAAPEANKAEANNRYVAITLTPELAEALDKARGETSRGLYARELVAKALNVTITIDRHAPKKYATEEERKEAQKQARLNRAELTKLLMKAHKARMAGNVDEANKLEEEAKKYY